jgi:hypothetical protein
VGHAQTFREDGVDAVGGAAGEEALAGHALVAFYEIFCCLPQSAALLVF